MTNNPTDDIEMPLCLSLSGNLLFYIIFLNMYHSNPNILIEVISIIQFFYKSIIIELIKLQMRRFPRKKPTSVSPMDLLTSSFNTKCTCKHSRI